jgi:hypothetical protein
MRWLVVLTSIALLTNCSAQWHLKKAVQKDPSIMKMTVMTVTDTVVTEPIAVRDTVTISQVDTVEIIKDKFRVKIMRSYDTLIIDGGCDSDTIVNTIEVPIETIVYAEHNTFLYKIQKYGFYLFLLLIFIRVLQRLAEKYIV